MEGTFEKSKNVYKSKVPDLEQTIELVHMMRNKNTDGEVMVANYSLCDTIFAKAKVRYRFPCLKYSLLLVNLSNIFNNRILF